jgi:hypothetical protein
MTDIDHFMWAVADLEDGIAWAADTFDCAPVPGGSHAGLGTRNALLSLGRSYLEIIAPDPAQPLAGTFGERLGELEAGGLAAWAASGDLTLIAGELSGLGIASRGPVRTQRKIAGGATLVWELLFPRAPDSGACLPFFIDWLDCAHPAETNPVGGAFEHLALTTPDCDRVQAAIDRLRLDASCRPGAPGFEVTISCRKGRVALASTAESMAVWQSG